MNPKYLALGPLLNDSITDSAMVAAGYTPPYAGFTGTLAQALMPYPQYFSVNDMNDHVGNSSYNSLMVKAEKRFSNGFQFLVSFTASKTLTDVGLNAFGQSGPQDTYNRGVEKALAYYDIPTALVISSTDALPWGPGRPYLNRGFLSQIAGGWAFARILNYTGGTPVRVGAPDTLPTGNDRLGSDYLGGHISEGVSRGGTVIENGLGNGQAGTVTLNRAAFGFPAPFTFGSTDVLPNIRTLGYDSENISIFKRETFRERYQFEIRFDMFNAFNRKDPGGLVMDITNPAFGQYTSNSIGPRIGMIGVKISF